MDSVGPVTSTRNRLPPPVPGSYAAEAPPTRLRRARSRPRPASRSSHSSSGRAPSETASKRRAAAARPEQTLRTCGRCAGRHIRRCSHAHCRMRLGRCHRPACTPGTRLATTDPSPSPRPRRHRVASGCLLGHTQPQDTAPWPTGMSRPRPTETRTHHRGIATPCRPLRRGTWDQCMPLPPRMGPPLGTRPTNRCPPHSRRRASRHRPPASSSSPKCRRLPRAEAPSTPRRSDRAPESVEAPALARWHLPRRTRRKLRRARPLPLSDMSRP